MLRFLKQRPNLFSVAIFDRQSNMIPAIENVGGDINEVTGKRCTIAAFPFKYPDAGHMLRVVAIVEE